MEKQGQTLKRHFSLDFYTWTCQSWLTSKNLHQLYADIGCSLEYLSGMMAARDGWRESASEKSELAVQFHDNDEDILSVL